ncbi:MAG: tape measure protein, partial [Eubacterium sp.]|nr:tape measure protein [Candidatus Colimonas fimequi]
MSREIDERVVQMKFDNTQFERETSRTMNTLQKLKASLNFTGVAKGFGSIASDTNIIHKNMQVLQGGVASVKREFSSLEVIGATCLVNLTNSAIRTGKMITNALTLEPVKTGFQEYETKMGAIQTIMTNTASKGTTMEQVIDVIDELNTYADKTIYNFAEMTRNIGTFTAAGVGLEDAASAIQGIANLAAASGSNSQQASTAMYQLSQALAAGTVKLMDWNSVVNAGMGGELFQNALKDTAREMGITVDEIIEKQGSFRESLSEGWLTADVLNTTLRKLTVEGAQQYADEMMACGKYTQEMSDSLLEQARNAEDAATKVKTFTQLWDTLKETAQSGWGKTWELIVGNFDQAKNLFTELNDRFSPLIDKFSDARNNLIESALGRPSKWNEIIKVVNKAGITTEQFEAKIKENMAELNINIDEQISQYGSLEGWITGCAIGTDVLKNTIKDLTGQQRRQINLTKEEKHTLEEWQGVVDAVWRGDFKNAPERYDLLADAEWDYVKVQDLVNATDDGHRLTVEELTAAQLLECAATDEQKKKLQAIINKMDESGESMDDIINSLYKPKEGRDLLIQSLYNVLDAIGSVIKPIGRAFKDAFSPLTADNVYSFLVALEKFTRQLILTDEQSKNLKNVLQILLTVLDGIRFVVGTVLRFAFAALSEILKGMNMNVSDFTGSIADATTKARDWIKTHDLVNVAISKLGPTLQSIGKFIDKWTDKLTNSENIPKDIAGAFTEGFSEAKTVLKGFFDDIWKIFGDSINNLFDKIGVTPVVDKMKSIYSGISDEVSDEVTRGGESESKPFVEVLFKAFSSTISDQLDTLLPMITDTISKVMGWIEKNVDPGMVVGGYFLMSAHDTLKSVIELADKLASPMERLGKMFDSVGGVFQEFSANIKAARFTTNATGIFLIAGAIAALAGALVIISKIPKDRLKESRDTLFTLIVLTGAMMALVGKIMVINKESQSLNLAAVMGVVVGLIAIVMAIKVLGNMDVHAMWQGIQGVGVCVLMLIALIGSIMLLTDLCKGVEIVGLGGFMVGFGLALLSMIATVKIASSMDKSTMKKGLAFVAGCTLLLTYLLAAASTFTGKGGLGAAAVLAVAGLTFATMIGVVMIAAQISMKDLKHGMKVVAGIEVLLLGLMFISKLGGGVKGAAALVMMSTSALIMVEVIKMVNKVTPDELAKGLAFMTYMGYIFAGFVIATALAGKNAHKGGVALLAFSAACLVMVGVCKLMGMLKEEELKKGLAAIVVLGLVMALIMTSTRGAEECHKNMLAVAAVMLTLTGMMFVMYALAGNKERFLMATAGIVLLMYGLYGIMKKGGTIKDENVKALKKVLTSIAVLLVIVAGIILLMEKMGIEKAEANANALKGLLGIVGLCILAISKSVDGIKKFDLPALAKLGGIMLVLIGAMALLAVLLKLMGDAGVGPVSMKLIGEMAALMIVL